MITNDQGWVALTYYQPMPKQIEVGNTTYLFDVKAAISMAWIRPEHVDTVLEIRKQCCGGSKQRVFRYANEDAVRIWTNGGGR